MTDTWGWREHLQDAIVIAVVLAMLALVAQAGGTSTASGSGIGRIQSASEPYREGLLRTRQYVCVAIARGDGRVIACGVLKANDWQDGDAVVGAWKLASDGECVLTSLRRRATK